ncbi:MAG: hypothetical protein WD400_03675 [Pontimonas sp.]
MARRMGAQEQAGAIAMMDIHFYGFLHLRDSQQSTVNVQVSSFVDQVRIYASNALTVSRSLAAYDLPFTLLTNQPDLIRTAHPEAFHELHLVEIPFSTHVPEGVRFFSGHYKLDVFRYLGQQADCYMAAIDLDMLAITPPPESLRYYVDNRVALAYDITSQVAPSTTPDALRSQLEDILGRPSPGRWSGGEFLAGPPEFFTAMTRASETIYERYLELIPSAARVGNEPYQAAALDILRHEGYRIDDAGTLGLVARYWNMGTKHHQAPFRAFQRSFMLHLPVDKFVLEKISRRGPLAPGDALDYYRRMKWQWLPLELAARLRKILLRLRTKRE